MRIGIALPNIGTMGTREVTYAIVDKAEVLGFDSVWVGDHVSFPDTLRQPYPYSRGKARPISPDAPILDPLATMAAIAGRSRRLSVGVSVLVLPYRHPLTTARLVSTMNELAEHEVILGVGVGWMSEEFDLLGVPFERRGAITDEQIRFFRHVWYASEGDFQGKFYTFPKKMHFYPKATRRIPIWVGGNTDAAMRRAARLGDGLHLVDLSAGELRQALDRFRRICRENGRAAQEVSLSIRSSPRITAQPLDDSERLLPLTGSLEQVQEDLRQYAGLGIEHVVFAPRSARDLPSFLAQMDLMATDLRPALG